MIFRTEVQVSTPKLNLSLQSKVVTIGSCFAEVIGTKLQENKVQTHSNPFGTLFNPLSVCLLLEVAAGRTYAFEQHLVRHNGIWYAYDLHSSLSSPSKTELLQCIEAQLRETRNALQQADLLIITLGTAVGYRLISTGEVVANCHKLPAKYFNRVLLTPAEITAAFDAMHARVKSLNPNLHILLTVSPVRHLKETIVINSVSKATLRLACHQLQEKHDKVTYFPAYEIMLDDLRDYRFYKKDMIHPTDTAEAYIWEKFTSAYFDANFVAFLQEWEKVHRALTHKAFHPASEAHQNFLKSTLKQLKHLEERYHIDLAAEAQQLQSQLLKG